MKNFNKQKVFTYLPLSMNIFLDASFTMIGQDHGFFNGNAELKEGNPFVYNIFNSEIGRNLFSFYFFILIYTLIAIFIIEKLKFKKKISNIVYLSFWVGHFMGLSGWWFVNVGRKILQSFAQNQYIWFFSSIFLAIGLTYFLYNNWIKYQIQEAVEEERKKMKEYYKST